MRSKQSLVEGDPRQTSRCTRCRMEVGRPRGAEHAVDESRVVKWGILGRLGRWRLDRTSCWALRESCAAADPTCSSGSLMQHTAPDFDPDDGESQSLRRRQQGAG